MAHVSVDARRIGPIGLDRDDGEAVLLDQAPRDRGAGAIEFRGAVGRLAEEHHLGIGEAIEHRAERFILADRRQRLSVLAHEIDSLADRGFVLVLPP